MNSDEFIDSPKSSEENRAFLTSAAEGRNSPGEWGGGAHMSTTPWPSRTETPPLVFPLNARRSRREYTKTISQWNHQIYDYMIQDLKKKRTTCISTLWILCCPLFDYKWLSFGFGHVFNTFPTKWLTFTMIAAESWRFDFQCRHTDAVLRWCVLSSKGWLQHVHFYL